MPTLSRAQERATLVRKIKRDGQPVLVERAGGQGWYQFNGLIGYWAKSKAEAIEQYADSIVRVSDFLRGRRKTV